MAKIIEIWRETVLDIPVRFTVGNQPMMAAAAGPVDEDEQAPIVKAIELRESGAVAGKRLDGPVFAITFEDSFVQRFIPAHWVVDVAYETKEADAPVTPALEA